MVEVLRGLVDGDLHPLDPAIESVAAWAVVRRDGGASVLADIAAVIAEKIIACVIGMAPSPTFLPSR